jgi:ribonucleotide reductase alpha subunit
MNPHLVNDLIELGLWNSDVKNALLALNGSVQQIKSIPENIKKLYKTVWEIPQRTLLDGAIARGPYICQSQSLNVYMPEATFGKMTSMHFYAWKKGLKTGQYYLRTRPSRDAIKFTVNIEQLLHATDAGDTDEILKCLNLAGNADPKGITALAANATSEEAKRDHRYDSITKQPDEDEQQFEARKRELENSLVST